MHLLSSEYSLPTENSKIILPVVMPVQGSHSKQKRPSSTLGSANFFDYWNKMCSMESKPVAWSLTLVLRQVLGSLLPVALHKPGSFRSAKIYRKISFSSLSYLH